MSKLSRYTLSFAIALGATALLANSGFNVAPDAGKEARLAANGAFRDGLYLGKLAGRNREPLHPPIGRWSTPQDRSMFAAGYERGYNQALAALEPLRLERRVSELR
jgi:hypothetical protein